MWDGDVTVGTKVFLCININISHLVSIVEFFVDKFRIFRLPGFCSSMSVVLTQVVTHCSHVHI